MATVSFAKVPGAGSSAPVSPAPAPVAEPEVVPASAGPQTDPVPGSNAPAVQSPAPPSSQMFYGGDEDDAPVDRGDVRLPRLNLVQGMSGPELKKIAAEGEFVLKQTLKLASPLTIVVAGCSRKRYAEKLPKFGEGTPRILDTLEDVIKAGGTDQWRQSRENKDADGVPVSRKPWFTPMVTALLLIQKPEGISPEDEEHFSAISEDGIAFAPCVYTVKSTSFGSFYVPLKSEQTAGVLRNGFFTHYVELTSAQARAFEPRVKILGHTSEGVRKLAKSLLS